MCLQCVAESKEVIRDIVPGYSLHIGTKDAPDEWPVGHYGVVKMNDPLFVFPPVPTPPDDDESPELTPFDSMVIDISGRIGFSLSEGYEFTTACIAAGYSPETHGYNVLWWFFERVYLQLNNQPAPKDKVVSTNVVTAALKFIAADFLRAVMDQMLIGNLVRREFEPVVSTFGEIIHVAGMGSNVPIEVKMTIASSDFFVPDIHRLLMVPDLLAIYMRESVHRVAQSIDRDLIKTMIAIGEENIDIATDQPVYMIVTPKKFEEMRKQPGFVFHETAQSAGVRALVRGPVGVIDHYYVFPYDLMEDMKVNTVMFGHNALLLSTRRVQQANPEMMYEYAELGNFGMTVDTYFESDTLRQRYFIEVLYGIARLAGPIARLNT